MLRAEASRLHLARRDPVAGQRPARARDAGAHVRDLPVRDPRPGDRPHRASPTPATTCRSCAPATRSPSCAPRACRWASCRASATRRSRRRSRPTATSCSTATGSIEAHDAGARDVRLRPAARGADASTTPAASCWTGCSRRSTRSPAPTTSRRTTSRSSPCVARPAWPRTPGCPAPVRGPDRVQPARRDQGNEREAMDRVAAAVADLGLPADRLERLKTAVSETAMNAIEYGSQGREDVPFDVDVEVAPSARSSCASPTARCPAPSRPTPRHARHRAQARRRAEAARLGPLPHRAHGRRDGRVDRRRRRDPDRHTADGPRGDRPWMTARSTPSVVETDDEVARPDAGRPRQPGRRGAGRAPTARSPTLGTAGGRDPRLPRRRLHQQHRHRARRPAPRRRPTRRPAASAPSA